MEVDILRTLKEVWRASPSKGLHYATRREGYINGYPKTYVKVLDKGICFHSDPAFGGALFLRAFQRKKKFGFKGIFMWV